MLRPLFRKWCIMFKKILKGIRNAELIIAGILFSTALVVLTLNVIFRRIPALPALDWAEEYMRYCAIWITFLGMALCAEDDSHVGVDIVYQLSPTKARKILKILCMIAACVFCACFSVACSNYVMMALKNMQRSAVMQVPLWIMCTCPCPSARCCLPCNMRCGWCITSAWTTRILPIRPRARMRSTCWT